MDFWIPLLGGALGAAFINGIFAYYKMKHDRTTEHDQWARNQRQTEYVRYIAGADALLTAVDRITSGLDSGEEAMTSIDKANDKFVGGQLRISLVAPEPILTTAKRLGPYSNALIKTCEDLLRDPENAAVQAAHDKARRSYTKGTSTFKMLARIDLGLTNIKKKHEKALRQTEEALMEQETGPS